MKRDICLVYLETSGNKSFIFGTNKAREIIGASEVVFRVGTELLARAVNQQFGVQMPVDPQALEQMQDWIDGQAPIEDGERRVEVIVATSGKALLLVRGRVPARELITRWSLAVALETPGVDATGVISDELSMTDPEDLPRAMAQVHARFDEARFLRTSPEARFQRLPLVEPCRSSGLPAVGFYRERFKDGELIPGSPVTLAKRALHKQAKGRLTQLLRNPRTGEGIDPQFNIDDMSETWDLEWLAAVSADGNGLGQIFMGFGDLVRQMEGGTASGRAYVRHYRAFSQDLDRATRAAFGAAAMRCFPNLREPRPGCFTLPVVPIIAGGDDLTVVCDGKRALGFTVDFLRSFEEELREASRPAGRIARLAFGVERIGMCAGVAIIKPNFPLHTAFDLADELLRSAKKVKKRITRGKRLHPACALDFHLVYDSSITDVEEVRKRLAPSEELRLHARPFVTTPLQHLLADSASRPWSEHHHLDRFAAALRGILAPHRDDPKERALPASQAHAIRAALHESRREAEESLGLALERYGQYGFSWQGSLFLEEPGQSGKVFTTVFQDALEAAAFCDGLPGVPS